MSFISKISKKTAKTLLGVGLGFSIGGVVFLVLGCQSKGKIQNYASNGELIYEKEVGTGSQNYGHIYSEKRKDVWTNTWIETDSQTIESMNKVFDATKPSYSDYRELWKGYGEEANKLRNQTLNYGQSLYYESYYKFANDVSSSNTFLVIGEVILPIFAIIMILGIATLIINKINGNKEKAKVNKDDKVKHAEDW